MKKEIYEKLESMKKYVELLKEYQKHPKSKLGKDLTLRGAVERYLQLSLEIVIEIAEMIIAKEGFTRPESHREAIEILGKNKILPKKFAERFAPSAGLRNILVHKYGEIDFARVYSHLKTDLKDFDTFARHIAFYLKKLKE